MIATPRAARRDRSRSLSRRGRALGASAIALTGIMSSYMQVLRTPSAYAATACTAVSSRATLDTAIGEVNAGTCDTITITSSFTLDQNPVAIDLLGGVSSSSLTINGGGFTIDGATTFRPFAVALADAESLTISNLTMVNGYANAKGGTLSVTKGLNPLGGNVTLDTVTIRDSRAGALKAPPVKGASSSGGAVSIKGNDVTITNSTFTGNKGSYGGAVYLSLDDYATILVEDSTFGGSATGEGNESWLKGGGLLIENAGYASVTGSTFTANYSGDDASAAKLYANYSVVVEDSTFTSNETAYAGTLYVYQNEYDTDPTTPATAYSVVRNSTFTGNESERGSGVYFYDATGLIEGSTFEDNHATTRGGAVEAFECEGVIVRDSEFTNNSAVGAAGAIFADNILTIEGSTFTGNQAGLGNATPYDGGAVFWRDAAETATVTDSLFEDNSANGDGGAIGGNGAVSISDSTIIGNTADVNGGGIGTINTVTLDNVSVLDNTAKVGGGGVHTTGTVTSTNSTIAENTADDGAGAGRTGGVSAATLNLNFTTVKDNTAVDRRPERARPRRHQGQRHPRGHRQRHV